MGGQELGKTAHPSFSEKDRGRSGGTVTHVMSNPTSPAPFYLSQLHGASRRLWWVTGEKHRVDCRSGLAGVHHKNVIVTSRRRGRVQGVDGKNSQR